MLVVVRVTPFTRFFGLAFGAGTACRLRRRGGFYAWLRLGLRLRLRACHRLRRRLGLRLRSGACRCFLRGYPGARLWLCFRLALRCGLALLRCLALLTGFRLAPALTLLAATALLDLRCYFLRARLYLCRFLARGLVHA